MAKSADSSELSQSMSVELRSVVLRYSCTLLSFTSSICPEIHCNSPANLSSALVRTRLALKDQSWYSEWFSGVLRLRLEGTTFSHRFLKSSTKRWRRIRRTSPQLLDHDFCHSDLFLQGLSRSLQGRHPCFQSLNRVDELLVLLLCQTHSCHGSNHNTPTRKVQGSGCSATTLR